MASTYSSNLRVELQTTGENRATWGIKANGSVNMLEEAITGFETIAMADANVVLTALDGVTDQSRNMFLSFTGAHTAIRTATIPAVPKLYYVNNATTGGFGVTISNGVGSVTIPNGEWYNVWTDGTTVFSAKVLDDYVEGTFTPTVVGLTIAGAGVYSTQIGRYTKIGRLVQFTVDLTLTNHTGTGAMQINSLPFTAGARTAFSLYHNNLSYIAGNIPVAYVASASDKITLRQMNTAGDSGITVDAAFLMTVSGAYHV